MLTFPDSLLPLYIAFLAWDEFAATHDLDSFAGAPRVPGQTTDVDADAEKMTGIAVKYLDDLIRDADTFVEDPAYSELKDAVGKLVWELYVDCFVSHADC